MDFVNARQCTSTNKHPSGIFLFQKYSFRADRRQSRDSQAGNCEDFACDIEIIGTRPQEHYPKICRA